MSSSIPAAPPNSQRIDDDDEEIPRIDSARSDNYGALCFADCLENANNSDDENSDEGDDLEYRPRRASGSFGPNFSASKGSVQSSEDSSSRHDCSAFSRPTFSASTPRAIAEGFVSLFSTKSSGMERSSSTSSRKIDEEEQKDEDYFNARGNCLRPGEAVDFRLLKWLDVSENNDSIVGGIGRKIKIFFSDSSRSKDAPPQAASKKSGSPKKSSGNKKSAPPAASHLKGFPDLLKRGSHYRIDTPLDEYISANKEKKKLDCEAIAIYTTGLIVFMFLTLLLFQSSQLFALRFNDGTSQLVKYTEGLRSWEAASESLGTLRDEGWRMLFGRNAVGLDSVSGGMSFAEEGGSALNNEFINKSGSKNLKWFKGPLGKLAKRSRGKLIKGPLVVEEERSFQEKKGGSLNGFSSFTDFSERRRAGFLGQRRAGR